MMEGVCKSGGTAYPYGVLQNGNMPTAGKTGTTSDFKDKWFLGYSPYYVAATWYGYDKPSRLQPAEYNQALAIWHDVMEKVHKNLQPAAFSEPPGIVTKPICIYSGKTPTALCSQDPRNATTPSVRPEIFIKGTEPADDDVCDVHVLAKVCKDSKDLWGRNLLFGPNCPAGSLIEQVFIQRKEEYLPVKPDDPYPLDWPYELPAGEYCNVHGAPASTTANTTN